MSNSKPDLGLYQAKYWLRGYLRKIPGLGGWSPNALSLFAFVPGVLAAYCLYRGWWLGAALSIAGRMIVNTLDGLIAEEFNKTSNLGAYLNRLPGEITDLLIVLALYPYAPQPSSLALIILTGWVQIFGLLGLAAKGKTQSVGPCGQTDRLAIVAVTCLAASSGLVLWSYVVPAMCLGCVLTIALRVMRSLKEITQLDKPDKPEPVKST